MLGTFETSNAGAGRVQVNIKWGTTSGDTSGSQITQFTQGGYSVAAGTNSLYNQSGAQCTSLNKFYQVHPVDISSLLLLLSMMAVLGI